VAATAGLLVPTSVEAVLAMLRVQGGRVTSARRILLEILFSAETHLTAEELAEAIQARNPDVHMSTVYRNLDELQRLGVVLHSHLGHGPATYQVAANAHVHLVCGECGTAVDAPMSMFADLARAAASELGFVIDPRHFAVLGKCSSCAARERPTRRSPEVTTRLWTGERFDRRPIRGAP